MNHPTQSTLTSTEVRDLLTHALRMDLIGPEPGEPEETEVLSEPPSRWYLTGYLVPHATPLEDRSLDDVQDPLDNVVPGKGLDDDPSEDKPSGRRTMLPASIGLTCLVPADCASLEAIVSWGDYLPVHRENGEPITDPRTLRELKEEALAWRRQPHMQTIPLALPQDGTVEHPFRLENEGGLVLSVTSRPLPDESAHKLMLPLGTRSISVFLVNKRKPMTGRAKESAFLFQARLSLVSSGGYIARPNPRGLGTEDQDERVADLQYRDVFDYATGHGVAPEAIVSEGLCREVRTTWIPEAEVERVAPASIPGEYGMESLSAELDFTAVRGMLMPIVDAYEVWIGEQRLKSADLKGRRAEVRDELLKRADTVRGRIRDGILSLEDDNVREAFRVANRAMGQAARKRLDLAAGEQPTWRPFQLAFILMNLGALADPGHFDRETVDLLFFPTGGGKTEAYLGLAAFTLVHRRLREPSIRHAGVAVLMRYTLRLLTLDQLGRATALVCALELERRKDPAKLGKWPFEIGLWVGQAATPNRMVGLNGKYDEHCAKTRTIHYQKGRRQSPPIPIERCPWCDKPLSKDGFILLPNESEPTDLRIQCFECPEFSGENHLPLIAVDEPLFRRLPAFVIATVDKFASLPWTRETGGLFGHVSRFVPKVGFFREWEGDSRGERLPQGLLPPELVIQDELHLISGPLGTVVGLYETAIGHLMDREGHKPKIIASTATVRRAASQIQALFGRSSVDIFPPPGPDRRNSFFAETHAASRSPSRLYVGIAAPGISPKVTLLRTYVALLATAQKLHREAGGAKNPANPVDPYMTLLGYFNSLRELGGSRRIVEDEVRSRLMRYEERKRLSDAHSRFSNRDLRDPVELTSRVDTGAVAVAKDRLARTFSSKDSVDVALATNMIAVGLDIVRLGLMVVFGQPKATAEYIQATSRVGRDLNRPGLVITLFNMQRPRDRSHYEQFTSFHESFYRAVEATSVTPFSPRALDRAAAAVTIALGRHGHPELTQPQGAMRASRLRQELDFVAEALARRAARSTTSQAESADLANRARKLAHDLLDAWAKVADEFEATQSKLVYHREVDSGKSLLHEPLDPDLERVSRHHQRFKAYRSMRDVEPTVNLWMTHLDGSEVKE